MPFQFSHKAYADIIFAYGYCSGSATQTVYEYWCRFPTRRIPDRKVFQKIFWSVADIGSFLDTRIASEKNAASNADVQEPVLNVVEESPHVSTKRAAIPFQIAHTSTWVFLRGNGLESFHLQPVQYLGYALR